MRRVDLVLAAALATPLVVATLGMASIAVAESAGGTFLEARGPANLAEAAASARADLVIGFLRQGHDPGRVYPVHPDVISSSVRQATPLEAAIWSRQLEMIELLDREGAIPPGGGTRRALKCLAFDLGVDEVVEYLAAPDDRPCVPEEARTAVMSRTSGADGR